MATNLIVKNPNVTANKWLILRWRQTFLMHPQSSRFRKPLAHACCFYITDKMAIKKQKMQYHTPAINFWVSRITAFALMIFGTEVANFLSNTPLQFTKRLLNSW